MANNDQVQMGNVLSEGYGIIAKKVMKDKDLSIEAKAIYAFLCSYTGKGDTAFPGVSLITGTLGISRQRYNKHREALEAKGYISVIRERKKNGTLGRNTYKINSSIPTLQKPTMDKPTLDSPALDEPTMDNLTNNNNISNNNSINNNKRDKNNSKEHARFSDFYDLYNKKKARPQAVRAFNKAIQNHSYEAIEKGTISYLKSIKSADKKYQKHPATFLNNECFLDEYDYIKGNLYESSGESAPGDDDFLNGL